MNCFYCGDEIEPIELAWRPDEEAGQYRYQHVGDAGDCYVRTIPTYNFAVAWLA